MDQHLVGSKILGNKIIWTHNYLGPTILFGINILNPKIILDPKLNFYTNSFLPKIFGTKIFLKEKLKLFEHTNFFDHKISLHTNFFGLNRLIFHDLTLI